MMTDIWAGRDKPDLDHIMDLFSNRDLGAFLSGHLILESVVVQMLEVTKKDSDKKSFFDLSFESKVNMANNRDLISEGMKNFLLEINRLRNRLAHRLGEKITFETAFELAGWAAGAGAEFSDEVIFTNKDLAREWYDVEGTLQEIFQNIAIELSVQCEEMGGEGSLLS